MKKQIFVMLIALMHCIAISAQCNFNLTDNWTNLTTCNGTASVSGSTDLSYYSGGGGWTPCPGSSVQVQLQKYNGSNWVVYSWQNVNTGFGSGTYSFTSIGAGQYRISGVPTPGSSCTGCGWTTFNKTQQFVVVNTPPSASFKVDGLTVNPTTYTQVYGCSTSTAQMTNITWAGTNSSYYWQLEVIQASSGTTKIKPWVLGTPPATFDLRNFILVNFGSIPGQYTVKL